MNDGGGRQTEAPPTRRFSEGVSTTTYYVLAAVGIAIALGLTICEAQKEDPLQIGTVRTERQGLTTVAEVRVQNQTEEPQCPELRIAARDSDGQDLDEAVARPVTGEETLAPGQIAVYRAELTGISESEYREELDEFSAYVWEFRPCP